MLYRASWQPGIVRSGWRVESPEPREFLFSRLKLFKVPRRLREPRLAERLKQAVDKSGFHTWLLQAGARGEDTNIFQFSCDRGGWEFPWEILVGDSQLADAAERMAVVRRLAAVADDVTPSALAHPLRLLVLKGYAQLDIARPLRIADEIAGIEAGWKDLPTNVRACIDAPVVVDATAATLPEVLRREHPDILWFSGHGRRKPESGLLFGPGDWVSPRVLFDAILSSGCVPLFLVLMACDTASGKDGSLDQPAFARLALEAGVSSVLAMQSPIGDVSARILARELFAQIALGLSPSIALARARLVVRENVTSGRNELDWAAPVVWSRINDTERWQWGHSLNDGARHQLFGRASLQTGRIYREIAASAPTESDLELARTWSAQPRTWVEWKDDGESTGRALHLLAAMQHVSPECVLCIDLRGDEPAHALAQWAERVMATIRPKEYPDDLVGCIAHLKANALYGWKQVAKLRGATIALLEPPDYDATNWLWQPFADADRSPRLIAFSQNPYAGEHGERWMLDVLALVDVSAAAERSLASAPRLARALAVLREPLGSSLLQIPPDSTEGAPSLSQWPDGDAVMVEIAQGRVMAASARRVVLESSTEEEIRQAHHDCAALLSRVPRRTVVFEEMANHLRAAGASDEYLQVASLLCVQYREEDRPHSVVRLLKDLGSLAVDLAPGARLRAAWAFAVLGDLPLAEYWLRRAAPTNALETAWKHGLAAEIAKARGDRDTAMDEIDAAISVCADALQASDDAEIRRRWRNYRHDKARILQYLDRETEKARAEYETLIAEWEDLPEAELDRAVVRRNYAECLIALSKSPGDPLLAAATKQLSFSRSTAANYPDHPLLAEVFYEEAKLAERTAVPDAREKLEECLRAARRAQYHQMVAIATARWFWRYEPFTLERWSEVEEMLEPLGNHGWPVRTLVDGRLSAAHVLEEVDVAAALDQLKRNERTLRTHPGFVRGSDRRRRTATAAGLLILSAKAGQESNAWNDLAQQEWAREYLTSIAAHSAEEVWQQDSRR